MKKFKTIFALISISVLAIVTTPTKLFAYSETLPVNQLRNLGNSRQVVLVTTESFNTCIAKIQTFEKVDGVWKQVLNPTAAVIGVNGFAVNKVEGDGKSPVGKFTLRLGFGKYDNPGLKVPYRKVTNNDYWVDDPNSEYYNTWQVGPSNGRWNSAENLLRTDSAYDYAMVINYNTHPIIKGKGSAIFFHLWRNSISGTAGCTATDEETLLSVMRWLDPAKKPVIVQGPASKILKHNKNSR